MAEPVFDMKNVRKPDLTIKLGDDKEIKMTYGLEMDLRRLLPEPNAVMQLMLRDPFTQDWLVRRALTDKKAMIVEDKDLVQEVDLSSDDVEKLLSWIAEHALYFFAKRVSAMAELGTLYQDILPQPSSNGSTDSATTTPSVGLLESTKETSPESTGAKPEEKSKPESN